MKSITSNDKFVFICKDNFTKYAHIHLIEKNNIIFDQKFKKFLTSLLLPYPKYIYSDKVN
jgi:hypothetical protein